MSGKRGRAAQAIWRMALPNLSGLMRLPTPTGMAASPAQEEWLVGMETKKTFSHYRNLDSMEENADTLGRFMQTVPSLAKRARSVLSLLEDRIFHTIRSRIDEYVARVEGLLDRDSVDHPRTIMHLSRAIRMLKRYKHEGPQVLEAVMVTEDDEDDYDDEELVSMLPSAPYLSDQRVDELVADCEDAHVRVANAWYVQADEAIDDWESQFEFKVVEHGTSQAAIAAAVSTLGQLREKNYPLYVEMRRAATARREALACSCEGLDVAVDEDIQRIDRAYRGRIGRMDTEYQVLGALLGA